MQCLTFHDRYIDVSEVTNYSYEMTPTSGGCPEFVGSFNLRSATAMSYFMTQAPQVIEYEDDPNKSRTGDPLLRILFNSANVQTLRVVDSVHKDRLVRFDGNTTERGLIELVASTYEITIGNEVLPPYEITQGAVNTLIVREIIGSPFATHRVVISEPNSMHMLWLLPQYIIMTLGEVMYSVTGLAFSYAEAPVSMKSVLQSCWLLTVAFGNVIDIIIIGARGFNSQAHEFFLFAGLMFVDMIIFMILAYRYKSIPTHTEQEKLLAQQSAREAEQIEGKHDGGLENVAFKKE